MKTLIAVLALGLTTSMAPPPQSTPAQAATPNARLTRAFAEAEEDLEVRRHGLGLLGSAPLFGSDLTCEPNPQSAEALAQFETLSTR
jgi:hypothetical protein